MKQNKYKLISEIINIVYIDMKIGINLQQRVTGAENTGGTQRLKSSSSMSCNNSCSTSTSKVFKTSASEGN